MLNKLFPFLKIIPFLKIYSNKVNIYFSGKYEQSEDYDAVIPVEEITQVLKNKYLINSQMSPNKKHNFLRIDIVKDDLIMDKGHNILPFDIGALLPTE